MNSSLLSKPTRILVVDDHALVREGLRVRIENEPDLEVCGEAESVDQALRLIKTANPDLIIVDLALSESHGLELIEQAHAKHPSVKLLVVTAYDEFLYAERCLRAGAHGYVNKREVQGGVVEAIRAVLRGERRLSARMTQCLLEQAVLRVDPAETDPIQRLSNRELEVFQMIGEGQTTSAIASALNLSVHTIDTHREKIRHKLGLRNGAELMRRAVQWTLESHHP